MKKESFYLRFTVAERVQHLLLILIFIVLFLSGFSLKYGTTETGNFIVTMMGGAENRSLIHRIGAIGLIIISVFHLLSLFGSKRGRDQFAELMIHWSDLKDFMASIKDAFTMKSRECRHGRYNPRQKIQYWLVSAGALSMIISGLFIWFHEFTLSTFGKGFFDIVRFLHSQEAMLILLLVVIWHLYDVHLREEFPMDNSWINGKISLKRLKKNHPLEYEKVIKEDTDNEK